MANKFDKETADKITDDGMKNLRELKASLDKHIKGVKENELEELGDLNKQKTDALKESINKDLDNGPPFGNLQLTPEQRVERRLKARITELEQRLDRVEEYISQLVSE